MGSGLGQQLDPVVGAEPGHRDSEVMDGGVIADPEAAGGLLGREAGRQASDEVDLSRREARAAGKAGEDGCVVQGRGLGCRIGRILASAAGRTS